MGARATSTALSSVVLGGWLTAATAHGAAVGAPQAPSWAQDQARDQQTVDTGDTVGVIPQPSIDSPGMVMGVTLGELYTDNLGLAGPGELT